MSTGEKKEITFNASDGATHCKGQEITPYSKVLDICKLPTKNSLEQFTRTLAVSHINSK